MNRLTSSWKWSTSPHYAPLFVLVDDTDYRAANDPDKSRTLRHARMDGSACSCGLSKEAFCAAVTWGKIRGETACPEIQGELHQQSGDNPLAAVGRYFTVDLTVNPTQANEGLLVPVTLAP